MSVFVQAIPAPMPKTKNVQILSLVLAALFVIFSLTQLFTFEKFPQVFQQMWLPGAENNAPIYAAAIVIFEVFSVPFFLRMALSPLMRIFSMLCGWLTVILWLTLFFWQNLSGSVVANSGLFGATLPLPTGWWSIFVMIGVGVLIGWVSWGLWGMPKRKP